LQLLQINNQGNTPMSNAINQDGQERTNRQNPGKIKTGSYLGENWRVVTTLPDIGTPRMMVDISSKWRILMRSAGLSPLGCIAWPLKITPHGTLIQQLLGKLLGTIKKHLHYFNVSSWLSSDFDRIQTCNLMTGSQARDQEALIIRWRYKFQNSVFIGVFHSNPNWILAIGRIVIVKSQKYCKH